MVDATTGAGCISHETRLIGERRAVSNRDFEVCLVQQCGRTQAYGKTVSPKFALGESVQFGVERCKKRLRRGTVTALGRAQ